MINLVLNFKDFLESQNIFIDISRKKMYLEKSKISIVCKQQKKSQNILRI